MLKRPVNVDKKRGDLRQLHGTYIYLVKKSNCLEVNVYV